MVNHPVLEATRTPEALGVRCARILRVLLADVRLVFPPFAAVELIHALAHPFLSFTHETALQHPWLLRSGPARRHEQLLAHRERRLGPLVLAAVRAAHGDIPASYRRS